MTFDPERDTPPNGARLERGEYVARYDAERGCWRIVAGPIAVVGAIAWTFSVAGRAMTRLWAGEQR